MKKPLKTKNLKSKMKLFLTLLVTAVLFAACSSTKTVYVDVPPAFDLKRWKTIGIVKFSTDSKVDLTQKATQRFMQTIQEAQPGVIILEIGDKNKVLDPTGQGDFNPEALKAIKESSNVDALFFANIEVAEPKTKVKLSSISLSGLSAKKKVAGELTAKLYDTGSGGVAWTKSSSGEWTLGSASMTNITIKDEDAKYNEMVHTLVSNVTPMFRPTRKAQRVPK